MEGSAPACHGVRVVSRRLVRPSSNPGCVAASPEPETVHLTPWDLQMLTIDHIQKGVLLPKPPGPGGAGDELVERLASSLARALARFHPFAGRLAVEESGGSSGGDDDGTVTVTVSLRCTGDGAEFVHAEAAGVTVADVAGPLLVPRVVWSLFPLDGLVGADAAAGSRARPRLAAQVTELADGVFVAMTPPSSESFMA